MMELMNIIDIAELAGVPVHKARIQCMYIRSVKLGRTKWFTRETGERIAKYIQSNKPAYKYPHQTDWK
jgi:hypothetical protein